MKAFIRDGGEFKSVKPTHPSSEEDAEGNPKLHRMYVLLHAPTCRLPLFVRYRADDFFNVFFNIGLQILRIAFV
jgi:hypothetical protein